MKCILLGLFLSSILIVHGQVAAPNIQWAYNFDGFNNTDFCDLEVDEQGNSYISIFYSGDLEIPELKKKIPIHIEHGNSLVKIDSSGKPVWSVEITSSYSGIISDSYRCPNGDILVTGILSGLTSYGNTKGKPFKGGKPKVKGVLGYPQIAFLARYTQDGELVWVKELQGYGQGLATVARKNGEVLWAVGYQKHILDENTVVDSTEWDASKNQFVLLKLNSTGEIQGKHPFRQKSLYQNVHVHTNMELDNDDNLILYGVLEHSIQLEGADLLTHDYSVEGRDAFILKFNTGDELLWAKRIGGRGIQRCSALTFDDQNRVYVTGQYGYECLISNGIEFDYASAHIPKSGSSFYYCRFSAEGDLEFIDFYQQPGYSSAVDSRSLALDANHRTHIIGSFEDTIDFDGRVEKINCPHQGQQAFYTRWKKDSLEYLDMPIVSNEKIRGSGVPFKIVINKDFVVVGGIYFRAPVIPNVKGKKFKFSHKDYGRSTFVYSFKIPLDKELEELEQDALSPLEPVLACLPDSVLSNPKIWVPLDTLIRNPEFASETHTCGVIRDHASAALMPNPTRGKTKLVVSGLDGRATIRIMDMKARILLVQDITLDGEEMSFDFDLTNSAPGTYLVQIIHQDYQKVLRLIKSQ